MIEREGVGLRVICGSSEDREFVYQTLKDNMADFFNRNTQEGWSDEKFHRTFEPGLTRIITYAGEKIGFCIMEPVQEGDESYMNVQHLQIVQGKRGLGRNLVKLLEQEVINQGIKTVKAKVFKDNERALRFFELLGYSVAEDIPEENSVYIGKEL